MGDAPYGNHSGRCVAYYANEQEYHEGGDERYGKGLDQGIKQESGRGA